MTSTEARGTYTAIVADDSDLARSRLIRLLKENCGCIQLIGEAADGIAAKELISTLKPDLAFLDIEMPGMSGIEAASLAEHEAFVIFITGYKKHAFEAFKTNVVDYILKPLTAEELVAAVERFIWLQGPVQVNKSLGQIDTTDTADTTKLQVKVGDSILFIPYAEIVSCEATQKYTAICTQTAEYLSDKSLTALEEILPKESFVRIHRKHIVNLSFVGELKRSAVGGCKVILTIPQKKELCVSRENIDKVLCQ